MLIFDQGVVLVTFVILESEHVREWRRFFGRYDILVLGVIYRGSIVLIMASITRRDSLGLLFGVVIVLSHSWVPSDITGNNLRCSYFLVHKSV